MKGEISVSLTFVVAILSQGGQVVKGAPISGKQGSRLLYDYDESSNQLSFPTTTTTASNVSELIDHILSSFNPILEDAGEINNSSGLAQLVTYNRTYLFTNLFKEQNAQFDYVTEAENVGIEIIGEEDLVSYDKLGEDELEGNSKSYEDDEGIFLLEEDEDTGGIGVTLIACSSSICVEEEEEEISSAPLVPAASPLDGSTMTVEEMDSVADFFLELALCMKSYKYKLTDPNYLDSVESVAVPISSSTTLNISDIVVDVKKCKIELDIIRDYIQIAESQVQKATEEVNDLAKESIWDLPQFQLPTKKAKNDGKNVAILDAPLQTLNEEEYDDDDDEVYWFNLFGSDAFTNVAIASRVSPATGDGTVPDEESLFGNLNNIPSAESKSASNLDEDDEDDCETIDIDSSILILEPMILPNAEDAPQVQEEETLIVTITQSNDGPDYVQVKKENLFDNPLFIILILLCSLIFSWILGAIYNKYLGLTEPKTMKASLKGAEAKKHQIFVV